MPLFSDRSQMMSKCGENEKVVQKVLQSMLLIFLPHFDVTFDVFKGALQRVIYLCDLKIC